MKRLLSRTRDGLPQWSGDLGSTFANLSELVAYWRTTGVKHFAIVEDSKERFTQVLVTAKGFVVCEVQSNLFLPEELHWNDDQLRQIDDLGFTPPTSEDTCGYCNHWSYDEGDNAATKAVLMMQRAMFGPFGLSRTAPAKLIISSPSALPKQLSA